MVEGRCPYPGGLATSDSISIKMIIDLIVTPVLGVLVAVAMYSLTGSKTLRFAAMESI